MEKRKRLGGILVFAGSLFVLSGVWKIYDCSGIAHPGADLLAIGLMLIFCGMWIYPRVG